MEYQKLIGTNFPPTTEVYPDYQAPVIVSIADGNRVVRDMRWGFPEFPEERGVRTTATGSLRASAQTSLPDTIPTRSQDGGVGSK
jgi:putative SOS response-associated peptidase YedK